MGLSEFAVFSQGSAVIVASALARRSKALANGQAFLPEGEPACPGEPRRGAPAVRPRGRFGLRCRLSFPPIGAANYQQ